METAILNFFYLILLINILWKWIKRLKVSTNKSAVLFSSDTGLFLLLIIIGFGPLFVFNSGITSGYVAHGVSSQLQFVISATLSLFISGIWLMYVRKIDIFEVEKWKHIVATFALGSAFSFLAILGYNLVSSLGFDLNGQPWNDLLYSVLAIGGIEELVKFIPVLIMLLFTKAIDEPYDYILYPSVSALGFAFIENAMYIDQSGLHNIGGRALYASVSHMVDASIIGYGLMLIKYRFKKGKAFLWFLIFFALAMLSHGFYDFWLINDFVSEFSILTVIFYLATIHIWFIFKNNAVNISNYYDPSKRLDNDQLKSYLLISLVSLLVIGYIIISLVYGIEYGNEFLISEWMAYAYMVLYLALSFSRYQVVKGQLQRFHVPWDFFIPKPIAPESKVDHD